MEGSIGESPDSERAPASNAVAKFEESFMNCLAVLTKEDTLTNVDKDEIRVDVEQGIQNVIECARGVESYFLKKKLEIVALKPELQIKDDIVELRTELLRKDELLKRNYEKINHWMSILSEVQAAPAAKPMVGPGPVGGQIQVQNGPPSHPGGMQPGPMSQGPMSQGPMSQGPMSQGPMSQGPMSVGPHTPMSQGPMTPTGGGRPNTPGTGRPQTPGRMPSSGMGFSPSMHQSIGSPQIGGPSMGGGGLQGPLAYLEKSASGIGMPDNR